MTAVNLCALVNGGQHLFFLYKCWMLGDFSFCRGRSGVTVTISTAISKGVPISFGVVAVNIRDSRSLVVKLKLSHFLIPQNT